MARQLLTRLLEDHQRMHPHHAYLCELCQDTKHAIDQLSAEASESRPHIDSMLETIGQCADRALVHRPQDEAPFFFTALLGEVLCHDGVDIGPRLLDLVDAATLRPSGSGADLVEQIRKGVEAASSQPANVRASYLVGRLEEIMHGAGQSDIAEAIGAWFEPAGGSASGVAK